MLCEEFKELVPEVYFGGCDVPAYMHIEMGPDPTIDELVSAIRFIGSGVVLRQHSLPRLKWIRIQGA
ncbi:MAG TPA: hypothetical protein VLT13_00250, partial [Bacteroidota bacterium]|nr:hypothetical protein [Bacteroidota bacterium]